RREEGRGVQMSPRAGNLPGTLEPQLVVEVLSLARQYDEMLKEARQDLFRAETKLKVERRWKWPILIGCVALGVGSVFLFQNEAMMGATVDFLRSLGTTIASAGYNGRSEERRCRGRAAQSTVEW